MLKKLLSLKNISLLMLDGLLVDINGDLLPLLLGKNSTEIKIKNGKLSNSLKD